MKRGLVVLVVPLLGTDCGAWDYRPTYIAEDCEEPLAHPADPFMPAWSYHGSTDGEKRWGSLPGYEACADGAEQSPIDIALSGDIPGEQALMWVGYTADIPVTLWNDGRTLQLIVATERSAADPHFVYAGTSYYLVGVDVHAPSEHTLDGWSFAMEMHFVHQANDGSYAVVALLLEDDATDSTPTSRAIGTMWELGPVSGWERHCAETVSLTMVPTDSAFFRYDGSLTTPDCAEGVRWFVLADRGSVWTYDVEKWQARFGGTTNRATQPLNDRTVFSHGR